MPHRPGQYYIMQRLQSGRWVPVKYGNGAYGFDILEDAIAQVCRYDQDGLFSADYRIYVDGRKVMGAYEYSQLEKRK